ncbi:MAG: hypothetical protein HY318_20115 [Armatimonadetes bacterium]|nr:hypothetical protein [Armatimonadota bacterium]
MAKSHRSMASVASFTATLLLCFPVRAGTTHFVEAEDFTVSGNGWLPFWGHEGETKAASRAKSLWGADGAGDSTASTKFNVAEGTYRLWVRYMESPWWGSSRSCRPSWRRFGAKR